MQVFLAVCSCTIFPESWKTQTLSGLFDGGVYNDLKHLIQDPSGWGSAFLVESTWGADLHFCLSQSPVLIASCCCHAQKGIFILSSDVIARKRPPTHSDILAISIGQASACIVSLAWNAGTDTDRAEYLAVPFRLTTPGAIGCDCAGQARHGQGSKFCLSVSSNIDFSFSKLEDWACWSMVESDSEYISDDEESVLLDRTRREANGPKSSSRPVPSLDAWDVVHIKRKVRKSHDALLHRFANKNLPAFRVCVDAVSCTFRSQMNDEKKQLDLIGERYSLLVSLTISGEEKGQFEVPDPALAKSSASYLYQALAETLRIDVNRIATTSLRGGNEIHAGSPAKAAHDMSERPFVDVGLEISGFDRRSCDAAMDALYSLSLTAAMRKRCEDDYAAAIGDLRRSCVFSDADDVLRASVSDVMIAKDINSTDFEAKSIAWKRPLEILKQRSEQSRSAARVVAMLSRRQTQARHAADEASGSTTAQEPMCAAEQPFVLLGDQVGSAAQGPLGTKSVFEGLALCLPCDRNAAAALVRGLFVGPGLDECAEFGALSLRLFVRGERIVVTIDDALPVDPAGALQFIRCEPANHFWAPLVEKALAKAYGGYSELRKCSPYQVAQSLTGCVHQLVSLGPLPQHEIGSGPRHPIQSQQGSTHCLETQETLGPESAPVNEFVIERTRLDLKCGYFEAVMRNLSLRGFDTIAHGMLAQHLSDAVFIGAWKANSRSRKGKEAAHIQEGHAYRITSCKVLQGVPFYQVSAGSWCKRPVAPLTFVFNAAPGLQSLGHKRNPVEVSGFAFGSAKLQVAALQRGLIGCVFIIPPCHHDERGHDKLAFLQPIRHGSVWWICRSGVSADGSAHGQS